jgi:glycosyltransferase involved in cell wall biosynthesis
MGYHDIGNLRASPDLFVALSPGAERWASTHASGKTRVTMIPNPIDTSEYKKVVPVKLGLPNPVVMVVGALSSYKNISEVIEAIRGTSVSLLLIGDGEEHDKVAAQLATLPNDFRWIHHLDPLELPSYYAAVDVFCFIPDPQEAFGRVYLEAMASGLPIVASDDLVRRGLVGQRGIFVDPHTLESISVGINRALSLGKVDYSHELKPYQLETVIKAIKKELHDLV